MLNITGFSLDNSRVTILFILFVVTAGITGYLNYPSREDPSITIREAVVQARFAGMSPERVEALITRKLEEKIREIAEVEDITSSSKTGVSIIHVNVYEHIYDLEPVWQSLRNKMNDLRPDLPDGTAGPFVDDEFGLTAVATIALTADGFDLAEMRDVARDGRDRLYRLDGIKKVELTGVQEERVYLEVDNVRLAEFGLTPQSLIDTLQSQNVILPGGRLDAAGQNVIIEPSGNFESVADIEAVLLPLAGSERLVTLRDIVAVRRGLVDPPEKPAYFNGRPAIMLSVSMQDGVNIQHFGKRLTTMVRQIENGLPIGYQLSFATYQPDLVEAAVSDAVGNVYQTLVIVLAVVMLFLGLRTGLIVGAIVPMAMLLALIVMGQFDIELQRISIAAMIIALGLLVDNGIVVAEDIRRRLEHGDDRREAAIAAGRALSVPLLTASLTTILAFLPMMLSDSTAGEFTRSLSQVIIIVLLGSWFLAMYVTPVLCYWFMRVATTDEAESDPYGGAFYQGYRRLLEGVIRWRLVFITAMIAAFVLAGFGFQNIVKQFFPATDRNQFLIYVDLPAGSAISQTERVIRRLSAWLAEAPENADILSNAAYVGHGGPRFVLSLAPVDPDPHRGFLVVNLHDPDDVPANIRRVRHHLLANFPEIRAQVKQMWLGPGESGLVQFRLVGPDAEEINRMADAVTRGLRAIPGTVDIKDDWENKVHKIKVIVDQAQARRAGITSEQIANSLSAFFDGIAVTDYREGDTIIPITIRADEDSRDRLSGLLEINIPSPDPEVSVPILQIARFAHAWQYGVIQRRNQERVVTVQAKHQTLQAGQLLAAMRPVLDGLDPAPGHRMEIGGELENASEAQATLFAAAPLSGMLILLLLVWQFNSFRRPLIILLTIPLSLIGAVVGLLVTQSLFGFMAILGLFSLAGIIINNGIVLIDRIETERQAGTEAREAVIAAAIRRLRPILMTTLTTVLGLMPLIFFGGPLWFAMANVIAFGLLVGTVLTLAVVPVLYTLFFGIPARPVS